MAWSTPVAFVTAPGVGVIALFRPVDSSRLSRVMPRPIVGAHTFVCRFSQHPPPFARVHGIGEGQGQPRAASCETGVLILFLQGVDSPGWVRLTQHHGVVSAWLASCETDGLTRSPEYVVFVPRSEARLDESQGVMSVCGR